MGALGTTIRDCDILTEAEPHLLTRITRLDRIRLASRIDAGDRRYMRTFLLGSECPFGKFVHGGAYGPA